MSTNEQALRPGYEYWDRLCRLPKYSFLLIDGGVRKVADSTGRWIERDAAQEVMDLAQTEVNVLRAALTLYANGPAGAVARSALAGDAPTPCAALPVAEAVMGPSNAEIDALACDVSWHNEVDPEIDRRAFARAVLARWGSPHVAAPADGFKLVPGVGTGRFSYKLTAKSGYEASGAYDSITPEQYGQVIGVLEGTFSAAPTPAAATTDGAAEVARPVELRALDLSVADLEAWEARADGECLTQSESESVSLVLHELKRLRAAPSQAHGNSEAVASDADCVLSLLEAAGHITPGKLDEAREIASRLTDRAQRPAPAAVAPPADNVRHAMVRAAMYADVVAGAVSTPGMKEQAAEDATAIRAALASAQGDAAQQPEGLREAKVIRWESRLRMGEDGEWSKWDYCNEHSARKWLVDGRDGAFEWQVRALGLVAPTATPVRGAEPVEPRDYSDGALFHRVQRAVDPGQGATPEYMRNLLAHCIKFLPGGDPSIPTKNRYCRAGMCLPKDKEHNADCPNAAPEASEQDKVDAAHGPMTEAPEVGALYWRVYAGHSPIKSTWRDELIHYRRLVNERNCFRTESDARAALQAEKGGD